MFSLCFAALCVMYIDCKLNSMKVRVLLKLAQVANVQCFTDKIYY